MDCSYGYFVTLSLLIQAEVIGVTQPINYNKTKAKNRIAQLATESHRERIIDELKRAGVHPFELHRHMFKLLPDIIRENEHIEAAAYGLNNKHWHAVLVATDHRVIYLEGDLVFSSMEEAPYEIVHGTEHNHAPFRIGLTLNTRENNYTLNYVNKDCAARFVSYIEDRVEKMDDLPSGFIPPHNPVRKTNKKTHPYVDSQGLPDLPLAHIYDVQREFLQQHHALTITHKSLTNTLESQALRYHMHGDALFAVADDDLTKIFDTTKPLTAHVTDSMDGRSLQLEVLLKVEMNPAILAKGLQADGEIFAGKVYRLQIIDLAFVASEN